MQKNNKNYLSAFIMLLLLTLVSCRPMDFSVGDEVTVTWDANKEPNIAGYKVYLGSASGDYHSSFDVGNRTRFTLQDLEPDCTYHISATAYSTTGKESGYSEELTVHTQPAEGTPGL